MCGLLGLPERGSYFYWLSRPFINKLSFPDFSSTMRGKMFLPVIILALILTGCGQDPSQIQEENLRLKKQNSRLEEVNHSLQEGNKVFQEQINRLNENIRKLEEVNRTLQEGEKVYQEQIKVLNEDLGKSKDGHEAELRKLKKKLTQESSEKITALEQENQKLAGEAKWLRSQRDQMRKGLTVQQVGGQIQELPFPFATVGPIVEEVLTKNGYGLLSHMETDQKAVYITEKKTTLPPSLELSGFRNQYILALEKSEGDKTLLWVRAEFEKISKNGNIFSAPPTELSDIELRLIQEIHQTLATSMRSQEANH